MSNLNIFIENHKKKYEESLKHHAKLNCNTKWRMRLRFRILSRFNTDVSIIRSRFMGRRIYIQSRTKGEPLNEADWIVVIARRFRSFDAAAEFGLALQTAISTIAAIRSYPVDVGFDNAATTQFGDSIKAAFAEKGAWLVDDVHGVDVHLDTQSTFVATFAATVVTTSNSEILTKPLELAGRQLAKLDARTREAASLVNAAFMTPHPVAMLALGIAAVELLAASERWNSAQKQWIKGLRQYLDSSREFSDLERAELRQAIDGLNHFGALSRSRRLLNELGLSDLVERWDDLYRRRSQLFHGSRVISGHGLQTLGGEAKNLSQSVLRAYVQRQIGGSPFDLFDNV